MKTSKKLLSILLSVIMVLTVVPLAVIPASAEPTYHVGDIIEFGTYPQSQVTDEALLAELNASIEGDPYPHWQSYGYYLSVWLNGEPSDFMQYFDTVFNGEKYRAVKFSQNRLSGTNTSYQIDTVYWFKYEPIKWRVLNPDLGFVLCESIIDGQPFQNLINPNDNYVYSGASSSLANNYAASSIRSWLNNDFYNTAFSAVQKGKIISTTIKTLPYDYEEQLDYYLEHPEFNVADTNDPIFLLSSGQAEGNWWNALSSKQAAGTDYAKCQGLSQRDGFSNWWLRSGGDGSGAACIIGTNGNLYHENQSVDEIKGVRPACYLSNLASDTSDNIKIVSFGRCGENVSYRLDEYGNLTVSGTGVMNDSHHFGNDERIRTIVIQEGVTGINNSAFADCAELISVTLPNTLQTIGAESFANTDNLRSVTILGGVTHIMSSAFQGSGLETVEILGNPYLSPFAFSDCENLTSINLPNNRNYIPQGAFMNCTSLTSITIPNTVTQIDREAFKNCGLTSVSIPANVTRISQDAFAGNDALTDVYYNGPEAWWNDITISSGNDILETATKHFSLSTITAQADNGGQLLSAEERIVRNGDNTTVSAKPNGTNVFDGWYNGETKVSSDRDYTFTVTESVNLTAKFKAFVDVDVFPTRAAGTIAGAGAQDFGEEVTVTATPSAGYAFDGWYYGNTKLSENPSYTFTLTGYEGYYLKAQFTASDAARLAQLANDGFLPIPTKDSDELANGDKWFNLDMILSMLAHYPVLFGIDEEDLEETLASYYNASYFYHYGNERIPEQGVVLAYPDGDLSAVPMQWTPDTDEISFMMLFYGLRTHGENLAGDDFQPLPLADDTGFAEGTYWFDLLGWETDNGLLAEEYTHDLDYELSVTYFYLGTVEGTLTLRALQFGAEVFDVTAEDDSQVPGLWNYLHKHVDLVDYQPLPTADSDDMLYGEQWLDLADFGNWARKEGHLSEQEIAAFGNATYYLYKDGSKIKAVTGDEAVVYTDTLGTTLFDFLHGHGVDLAEGYTLMPYAESDDLANGAYYFDKAALAAEAENEGVTPEQVEAMFSYVKLYINGDGTDVKSIEYNTIVGDLTPELYVFIRQHLEPQEVFRVDEATETFILADPGVLVEAAKYLVEVKDAVDANVIISDGNRTLDDVSNLPYELTLVDGAGAAVQPDGEVLVRMPLPEGFDATMVKVYYVDDEGNAVDMNAVVEDGYIIFRTTHFSTYVVVDETCLHEGETELRGAVTATCKTEGYSGDLWCLVCNTMIEEGHGTGLDENNHEGDTELRGVVTGNCHTEGYTGDTWCLGCNTKIADGTGTGKDMSKHDWTFVYDTTPSCTDGWIYWPENTTFASAEYCSACGSARINYVSGDPRIVAADDIATDEEIAALEAHMAIHYDADSNGFCDLCDAGIGDNAGFTLLPTADSEELAYGAYWFNMEGAKEYQLSLYEPGTSDYNETNYMFNIAVIGISDDGNTLRFVSHDARNNPIIMVVSRDEPDLGELWFSHLHQHGIGPVELEDPTTEVTVTAEAGVIPENTALVVVPDAQVANFVIGNGTVENYNHEAFDISLEDANGNEVQPQGGSVTVKLPIPVGYDKSSIKVYFVDDNGNKTDMNATVEGDYAVFTVDHFSKYVLVDETCLHNGKTEVRDAVTATCKTEGYTGDTWCLVCGNMIEEGESTGLDENNHEGDTELRGVVTGNCHTDGYTGDLYCLGCGNVKEAGHSTGKDMTKHDGATEIRGKVDAKCTTKGYTGDTYCKGCNTKISTGTDVDALGHTDPDGNGNCTRCGAHIKDVDQGGGSTPAKTGSCKYCGEDHTGFFGFFVKIFHSILALFGLRK